MDSDSPLDRYDREILRILSQEGRLPVTELAARIGLSKTPCQVRFRRLIAEGFIRGFKATLDPALLGMEQVTFVEVRLTDTTEGALGAFNDAVRDTPEIEQCHMIAGSFDYLLKIRTRDMRRYREVLANVVTGLPHVASTSTHVSMQSVKDDSPWRPAAE